MKRLRGLMKLVAGNGNLKAIAFMILAVSSFYAAMSFFAVAMFLLGADKNYYNWQPWDIVLQPMKAFIGVGLVLLTISIVAFMTVGTIAALSKCWITWTRSRKA